VRRKNDASINRCMELLKNGEADAVVAAGNSGAVVAAAMFNLGRIKGVARPAIATVLPTRSRPLLLLDAGANTDCQAEWLAQFAIMGTAYSQTVLHQANPVLGLLSIGTEDCKGNEVTKKAFVLIQHAGVNFRGNVEGHDLFIGHTDVVVCDGFVGNIVLKSIESLAVAMFSMLKRELMHTTQRKLGAFLAKGAFQAIRRRMDPEVYGGAPMLGFNGLVFKAHASARERAVTSAIRVTVDAVKNQINQLIAHDIAAANQILDVKTVPPANA